MPRDLKTLCTDLEHFETPIWAVKAILNRETLTRTVLDPCVGSGIIAEQVRLSGIPPLCVDIHDWGYDYPVTITDFLTFQPTYSDPLTVIMNPPFSKAVQFVENSIAIGAQKIIAFQRFAWWESESRRSFWEKNPPARVYICGNRADCWRHDIPVNKRGKRYNPETGKELSNSPTAHAWFVWEKGFTGKTTLGHIWKSAP